MIYLLIFFLFLFTILAWYRALLPAKKGFRVLMYHHIKKNTSNDLVVSVSNFEQQLAYLSEENYTFISCEDLISSIYHNKMLPQKSVLLTFDDAYIDFVTEALPIINKYKAKAVVFVPVKYIGGENEWDKNGEKIMNNEQLKSLPNTIEIGIHSYSHQNYQELSISMQAADLAKCIDSLSQLNIAYTPALAYPYGGHCRKSPDKEASFSVLQQAGIKVSFRIGNKINPIKLTSPFLIKRLDIKGSDHLQRFIRKIKYS